MRAAAVQLNSTDDKDRNLAAADRLTRAAAADGADARRAAREVQRARHPRGLPGRRRDARRADRRLGARHRRASSASTSWPAPSSSAARTATSSRTPPCTSGPDGELKAVYRKIHMFDVEVGGQAYRESESQEGGHEIVVSETADGVGLGHDRLLRPALPGAVPHPRRAGRPHAAGPGRVHQGHGRGALGDPDARPRDREPGLRGGGRPGGPPPAGQGELRRLDDRRPVGRRPRPRARRGVLRGRRPGPRAPGRGPREAAEPRQPRARRPTAGPPRRAPDGHRPAHGAGGQAPR